MYRIGLSTCGRIPGEDLFRQYHESGIGAMEISCSPKDYANIPYRAIQGWAREFRVELWSFHLPFSPFTEIDISKADLCRATVAYYKELMEKAAEIGIKRFVIHPSGEPISEGERPGRMECAKESLAALAEIARKNNAVVAVENLPRSCLGKNSEEIEELIRADADLMVCFDLNHLLGEDTVDFINKTGNRILTVHVSDYDGINERHWLPGEGKVDWQAVLKALRRMDYAGVWMYEVGFSCPKTILRSRDLTCGDFVKNAQELFENKEITVFSTPKENLGMWE